jgi:hypothetical protein
MAIEIKTQHGIWRCTKDLPLCISIEQIEAYLRDHDPQRLMPRKRIIVGEADGPWDRRELTRRRDPGTILDFVLEEAHGEGR